MIATPAIIQFLVIVIGCILIAHHVAALLSRNTLTPPVPCVTEATPEEEPPPMVILSCRKLSGETYLFVYPEGLEPWIDNARVTQAALLSMLMDDELDLNVIDVGNILAGFHQTMLDQQLQTPPSAS